MSQFQKAIEQIDLYNKQDPNYETENGQVFPKEYLNSIRQSLWLEKIAPNASEALQIATRSQHMGRWEISRTSYPLTRTGYLQWRSDLALHHAQKTAKILTELKFEDAFIERVEQLNLKKNIKLDSESQTIEDVLCLVFLEYQLDDFAKLHEKDKLLNIIQKTWKKMGSVGKTEALKINYPPQAFSLLQEALNL